MVKYVGHQRNVTSRYQSKSISLFVSCIALFIKILESNDQSVRSQIDLQCHCKNESIVR